MFHIAFEELVEQKPYLPKVYQNFTTVTCQSKSNYKTTACCLWLWVLCMAHWIQLGWCRDVSKCLFINFFNAIYLFYSRDESKQRLNISRPILYRNTFQFIATLPYQIIGYLAIHTFGIKLMYPGAIGLLQMFLGMILICIMLLC